MGQIDQNILQSYYDSRNYEAAANYLRTATAKDYNSQLKLNAHIRQLERDAAIQKSIYNSLNENDREAYEFTQALNGIGVIPRDRTIKENGIEITEKNGYGTTYIDNINSLSSNDGKNLNRIAINIANDDDLNAFTSALNINDINSNDIGIRYQILKGGQHRIILDKGNKNLYKVLKTINDLNNDQNLINLGRNIAIGMLGETLTNPIGGIYNGIKTGFLESNNYLLSDNSPQHSLPGNLMTKAVINNAENKRFAIYGVDSGGKVYSTNEFNYSNLQNAMSIADKANTIYTNINKERDEGRQDFTTEIQTTQFLGAGHAEAFKALQRGEINYDTYNNIVKTWEDGYNRLISIADFTKHDVYAWSQDSEEGEVLNKVDNADIPDLKGEVLLAMNEGRLEKSLAINDGEIGTLLVISPKNDGEDWSKAKGEVQKMIFIPGLFEGDAEKAFETDTKAIAAKQNADMKRWNYEQKLSNGNTVGYSNGVPYIKQLSSSGKPIINSIPEEDLIKNLNESAIIEGSVQEILAKVDENGELPYQTINGKRVKPTAESKIRDYSIAATEELYPSSNYTVKDRLFYQNNIYNIMLSLYNKYYSYQRN